MWFGGSFLPMGVVSWVPRRVTGAAKLTGQPVSSRTKSDQKQQRSDLIPAGRSASFSACCLTEHGVWRGLVGVSCCQCTHEDRAF